MQSSINFVSREHFTQQVMAESLEACNRNFLEGLQSLASKQEGGSASLLKISEIEVSLRQLSYVNIQLNLVVFCTHLRIQQASNNAIRLKQQTLSATLQNLETENEQHQTAINIMRSSVASMEKARAIAQKIINAPNPTPASSTATYHPIPKKEEFRNTRFDRDEDCTPEVVKDGRLPMPSTVSEKVINTALENARRRSHVSNPCEGFVQGTLPKRKLLSVP